MKTSLFMAVTFLVTLLFCVAIGLDISPYLRGPSYYPPEWRWEYLFENTMTRVYAPIIIVSLLGVLYYFVDRKKISTKLFLVLAVLLFTLLQFSVLYFSRSGIGVLMHRIIDPEINGYFTASLSIMSVPDFLRNYNSLMLTFVYHAKAHPPGAILFFYYIDQLVKFFPQLGMWASLQTPTAEDVRIIWNTLTHSAKATVVISAFIIPVLSSLSLIPLYYTAVLLYGRTVAYRSVFLFALLPSLIFFIPINDIFLHIFSITAFAFFVYGLKKQSSVFLVVSGMTMFCGSLFNLSLLPVLVFFFSYFLLHEKRILKNNLLEFFKRGSFFLFGLVFPFGLLYLFFQFNFITMTVTIMKYVPDVHTRSYALWVFYNLYDFFVFAGLPCAFAYFLSLKQLVINALYKRPKKVDIVLIAFTCMLCIVNFSGSIRGETGRIWIPYLPFLVLIVSNFVANQLKLSNKQFLVFLVLQIIQILVMQEFWVMLW